MISDRITITSIGPIWPDRASRVTNSLFQLLAAQSELARRGYYRGPRDGVISSGNSQSTRQNYSVGDVRSSYGSATAGAKEENLMQAPNEPTGPGADPNTLAPQATPQAQASAFDKLVLVSWLNDSGKDVIFVQDTQTNGVQKITSEPNKDNFRIVAVHPNLNPKLFEAAISDGSEQRFGQVPFRDS
jgi:hypothetical protein